GCASGSSWSSVMYATSSAGVCTAAGAPCEVSNARRSTRISRRSSRGMRRSRERAGRAQRVVLRRLGSGDDVKDAEVEEHGDWELRERGALVASSRKCRVQERGKEARRDPQSRTYREAWLEGATYEDSDGATTTRRKYACHWCMYAEQDPPEGREQCACPEHRSGP
ncbi:hypothetical protein B0H14DRAFT_2812819, partial [Mycena olivaceomarginata]